MRIGLIEVSHWHFPLYAQALARADVQVVAVCDRNAGVREREAARFGARAFATPAAMLETVPLDFAFVFERHARMPAVAMALVERGIPFALEKPGALRAVELAGVGAAAAARGLFVAVPFVQLLGPVYEVVKGLMDAEGARFVHSSWRFIGGPPARYEAVGCGWLLDPAQSGGGCLINLAPHFIDLAHRLHGLSTDATARLASGVHGAAVEDHAVVSIGFDGGASAEVEVGYCFPAHPHKREYSFSLVGERHYVRSTPAGLAVYRAGADAVQDIALELDADPLYASFVRHTLGAVRHGHAPVAGLPELEAVMRVVDLAYGRT